MRVSQLWRQNSSVDISLILLKPWVRAQALEMKHLSKSHPPLLSWAPSSRSSAWYVLRFHHLQSNEKILSFASWDILLLFTTWSVIVYLTTAPKSPQGSRGLVWQVLSNDFGNTFNWCWRGRIRVQGSKGQEEDRLNSWWTLEAREFFLPSIINCLPASLPWRSKARGHLRNVGWTRMEIG